MDTETEVSATSETGQRWKRTWVQPLLFPPDPALPPGQSKVHTTPTPGGRSSFPHWAPRHAFLPSPRGKGPSVSPRKCWALLPNSKSEKSCHLTWAENAPGYLSEQPSQGDSHPRVHVATSKGCFTVSKMLSRHHTPPWFSQSSVTLNRPHFHP